MSRGRYAWTCVAEADAVCLTTGGSPLDTTPYRGPVLPMPAQILPAGTYTFTVVADAGVLLWRFVLRAMSHDRVSKALKGAQRVRVRGGARRRWGGGGKHGTICYVSVRK